MVAVNVAPFEIEVTTRHGDLVRADVYLPKGAPGPVPVLLGASRYQKSLRRLPADPTFPFIEYGPIQLYLDEGYAYVAMDVPGMGRSTGTWVAGVNGTRRARARRDTTTESLKTLETNVGKEKTLLTFATDIADPVSCGKLANFARDKVDRVDILVNCAGFFPTLSFADMTLDDWNKVIGINLTGVLLMCKAILLLMQGRGWGRIINIESASMFDGVAEQAHYVAAKMGVLGFSRSLARAVGLDHITVNVVTPGLTVTSRVKETMPAAMLESQIKARAIQREEKGEDLVGAVFFLASPDSDFVSGQTINVDGGKHMI